MHSRCIWPQPVSLGLTTNVHLTRLYFGPHFGGEVTWHNAEGSYTYGVSSAMSRTSPMGSRGLGLPEIAESLAAGLRRFAPLLAT